MPEKSPAQPLAQLRLLGTGTCQLQPERAASSVLVEWPDLRLVFDFGRGIALRLTELGYRQDDVEHIVLSHFHPDHLSDLVPYLHAACWSQIDPRHRDLHIHGPVGLKVQMMRLLSLFGPHDLARPEHFQVHLHELPTGTFELAGHSFDFVDLPPAGNHGLRFELLGQTCALTGDSFFHDAEVEFLCGVDGEGVDVAVIDSGHLSDEEIVELAVRSQPGKLVCSHLYREVDASELQVRASKRGFRGEIVRGEDGQRLLPT